MPKGIKLVIGTPEEDRQTWILEIPFRESYTITEAAQIIGRNRVVVRDMALKGRLERVTTEGVQGVTHTSLLDFLATEEQKVAERAVALATREEEKATKKVEREKKKVAKAEADAAKVKTAAEKAEAKAKEAVAKAAEAAEDAKNPKKAKAKTKAAKPIKPIKTTDDVNLVEEDFEDDDLFAD